MKKRLSLVAGITSLVLLTALHLAAQEPGRRTRLVSSEYESVFDALLNLQADASKVAAVHNLTISRDVATFELSEGEICLLHPIKGRVVGAIFRGHGVAHIKPPTQIERDQLHRFYGAQSLVMEFSTLVILFADSTLAELERQLDFGAGRVPFGAAGDLAFSLKFLSERRGKYIETGLARFILEDDQNSFWRAHFSRKKSQPIVFQVNPYDVEEIRLMKRARTPRFRQTLETVCQFHKQEDYLSGSDLSKELKDLIRVNHYEIDSRIDRGMHFRAGARVTFTALEPDRNWLHFALFADMEVDSAFWDGGKPATFFKSKDNPILWLKTDRSLQKGDERTLTLFYHGDLIGYNELGWVHIKSSTGWYPRYGTRSSSTFDLVFDFPSRLKLVSVGELVSSTVKQDVTSSRWVTDKPIRNASFNIGAFKVHEVEDKRIPPISVYMAEEGHADIALALRRQGITSGAGMERQVGADVANSMSFYEHVFGESSMERFYATEVPYTHGEAFPGLIHLSWTTFQRDDEGGLDAVFRGHEVAHQWWGIEVDFATYHDQWLSEAFAEYAGLWYMQAVLKDNKKVFKVLQDSRKAIANNRKLIFGSGQEAGPIWLGYRTGSSETQGDYSLIVYRKGAWVLHMLRMMMIDTKTMSDDRFINLMRDFYETYRGRKASTEDFQRVVEKHTGQDMSWFFAQWVYGTDVPKYRYSYRSEERPDGRYQVQLRVRQEEVCEDFRMYCLLRVEFGENRMATLRVLIDKPEIDIVLPIMPLKPKKVTLNALESVLAEVKKEKWEG